jgi:hypothetical protein
MRHVQPPPDGQVPFAAEVAFGARNSLRSNQTSTPTARSDSQVRAAADASWEAQEMKTAPVGKDCSGAKSQHYRGPGKGHTSL